jgi:hypothetical protein
MNRLLEIAKQAGIKGSSEAALSPQELTFAKLIVDECLCLVDDENGMDVERFVRMCDDIRQYFGVEE